MTDKALVLVDFESEWVNKNSDYYVGDISKTIERTNKVIEYCRKSGYKIIFTRHVEKGSTNAFAANSRNTQIIAGLDKRGGDVLITKNKISPFYKTNLEKELGGIRKIVICGILTNLCVRSLAQDAYDRDFRIKIISDCCVALSKQTQEFTLRDLKETREELEVMKAEQFIR